MADLHEICAQGYVDGKDPSAPDPGNNQHPAFIHGFRAGRDDAKCQAGLKKFPSRNAQEARDDWAFIEVTCGLEVKP